ncbi:hypothetical protein BURK1_03171 [Burkholderiales bacterium]|nr:hypothetical protein BURK1_03171 [Burkholderiales bacterium]
MKRSLPVWPRAWLAAFALVFAFAGSAAPARADTLDTMLDILAKAGVVDPAVKDAKPLIACLIQHNGNPAACVDVKSIAEQQGKTAAKKFMPEDPAIQAVVGIVRAANQRDWLEVLELTGTDLLFQIACKAGLATTGPMQGFICGGLFKEVASLAKPVVHEVLVAFSSSPPDIWRLITAVSDIDLACKLTPDFPGKDEACSVFGKALAAIGGAAADTAKYGAKLVVAGADALENVLFGSDAHMPYDKYYALYWLPWFHLATTYCITAQDCPGLGSLNDRIRGPCVEYFDSHNQYESTAKKTCSDMRDKRFSPGAKSMAKAMIGAGEAHAGLMRPWARTWAVEDYGKDTLALRRQTFVSNCEVSLRKEFPFPDPDPALCELIKKMPLFSEKGYQNCMSDIAKQSPSPSAATRACKKAEGSFVKILNDEKAAVQKSIQDLVAQGCFPPAGWTAKSGLKLECDSYGGYGACLSSLKAGAEKQHCSVNVAKAEAKLAKSLVASLGKRCQFAGNAVTCTRPWKVEGCESLLASTALPGGLKPQLQCKGNLADYQAKAAKAHQLAGILNGVKPVGSQVGPDGRKEGIVLVIPGEAHCSTPGFDKLGIKCGDVARWKTSVAADAALQLGHCANDPARDGSDDPCYAMPYQIGQAIPDATFKQPPSVVPPPSTASEPPMTARAFPAQPRPSRSAPLQSPLQRDATPAGSTSQLPAVQAPPQQRMQAPTARTLDWGAAGAMRSPPPGAMPPPPAAARSQPPPSAVVASAAAASAAALERELAAASCTRAPARGLRFACTTRAGFDRCEAMRQQRRVEHCAMTR